MVIVKPHRILVAGASGVGKTSLLHELLYCSFSEAKSNGYEPCLSPEDFYEVEFEISPEAATTAASNGTSSSHRHSANLSSQHIRDVLRLIDTTGVAEFSELPRYFTAKSGGSSSSEFVNIDAVLILYSVTDANTFRIATQLYSEFARKKDSKSSFPIMLLGTKTDLVLSGRAERQTTPEDISKWAENSKAVPSTSALLHFEVSLDNREHLLSCFTQFICRFHPTTKSGFAIPGFRKK